MQYRLQIKSYYILNSQNQVKFYVQIRLDFPGPVTFYILQHACKISCNSCRTVYNYGDFTLVAQALIRNNLNYN